MEFIKTWGGDTEYPMFVKLLKIATVGMGSNAVAEQGFSQLGKLIRKDQSTMLPENSDNILFIGAHASKFPEETFKELQEQEGFITVLHCRRLRVVYEFYVMV